MMIDVEMIAFRQLVGAYKHFCPDWDEMAIDEYCREFECCTCEKQKILERNANT